MKLLKLICTTIFIASLSGCYIAQYSLDPNGDNVSGTWQDNAGMISDFHDGKFKTYTPDTNETLSEGTYQIDAIDPALLTIELKSLVKGTVSQLTCNLSHNRQKLYCVSPPDESKHIEAKSFQLTRAE